MYVVMAALKDERMYFRVRADVKADALALAELRKGDLTELVTHLIVQETDRENKERPQMLADAAKRVAKRLEERSKSRKKRSKPLIRIRPPTEVTNKKP